MVVEWSRLSPLKAEKFLWFLGRFYRHDFSVLLRISQDGFLLTGNTAIKTILEDNRPKIACLFAPHWYNS